eukprot:GHVP01064095.1.p1 GENE.GHVP01064095.1~~GHVP01064095.1.p1  ORF type:complete len:230 (+),score=61.43 GHVP01064095.1:329-1018(+)
MGDVAGQKLSAKSSPVKNSILWFSNDSDTYLVDLVQNAIELQNDNRESTCDKNLSSELSQIASLCEILESCDCGPLVEDQLKDQIFHQLKRVRECINETEKTIDSEETEETNLIHENSELQSAVYNLQNLQTKEKKNLHSQINKRIKVEEELAEFKKAASKLEILDSLSDIQVKKTNEESKFNVSKESLYQYESKLKKTEEAVDDVVEILLEVEHMANATHEEKFLKAV